MLEFIKILLKSVTENLSQWWEMSYSVMEISNILKSSFSSKYDKFNGSLNQNLREDCSWNSSNQSQNSYGRQHEQEEWMSLSKNNSGALAGIPWMPGPRECGIGWCRHRNCTALGRGERLEGLMHLRGFSARQTWRLQSVGSTLFAFSFFFF